MNGAEATARGENPVREKATHLIVEDICKTMLGEVITLWSVRELIFEGVSPWYLYVKDCLFLYVCKCHKEHRKPIRGIHISKPLAIMMCYGITMMQ